MSRSKRAANDILSLADLIHGVHNDSMEILERMEAVVLNSDNNLENHPTYTM